ncbi:MAG: 16S rRNA (cytidine(1402)-2'-O)-methyltransferase, partial [Chitinophagales bacterium]|nr:16S rRNA (cytidine(1402)-2'-O)-methyltransferase [Hyphomicrobiales bacterium]
YHDHSDGRDRLRIIGRLQAGGSIALISDAGTPLISDPGFKLVRDALDAGVQVFPIPGPAAAIAALTMSGVPASRFLFAGFPPPKSVAREETFRELASVPAALTFYEAANRLHQTLADMAQPFAGRDVAIAREITKLHEELRRGRFPEFAAEDFTAFARGEAVIIVGPPVAAAALEDEEIAGRLAVALKVMSVKDAADTVASALGIKRKRVYDIATEMKHRECRE